MNKTVQIRKILLWLFAVNLFMVGIVMVAWSQESTIDASYQDMMDKAETYEKFKVISSTRLQSFWQEVKNHEASLQATISEFKEENKALKTSLEEVRSNQAMLERQLAELREQSNTIGLFGIQFSHLIYHIIVWSIILVLTVAFLFILVRHKAFQKQFITISERHRQLEADFEDHRAKAQEKMIKTKRELQTALNKLAEV